MSVPREDLLAAFRKNEFAALYLFCGDEDLLAEEALEALISSALRNSSKEFDLDIVYGGEASAAGIAALASSYPMSGPRRVVVVKEFEKLSAKDFLIPYIEHPSSSSSLVIISSKPDFRLKVFKALAEHAVVAEFTSPYESEIPGWIVKRCEAASVSIAPEAAALVHSYVGRSLRELQNELDKLSLFIGKRAKIGVDDVNAVVGMSRQFNVFELQASIGAREYARALEIVGHLLEAGESAIGLVTMLTRYYGRLWVIADCLRRKMSNKEIAAVLKFSSKQMYYLEAELKNARRFTLHELESGFRALLEADERLKTSQGSIPVIMTLLLHRLFHSAEVSPQALEYA
jgi:DNA polymerase-3 subunit delta